MKKLISFLLSAVMCFSVFNCVALTTQAAANSYFNFSINTDDYASYTVICHEAKYDEVVFPSEYNGLPVTKIEYVYFPYKGNVKVVISESITEISDYAFENTTCISEFYVDEDNQFYKSIDGVLYSKDGKVLIKYPQLKSDDSFIVPDGVEIISDHAFARCENLKNVYFPDSVERVGGAVFESSGYYYNSENWENGALYNNNHLICVDQYCEGEFVVKEGTKSIASGAFGSNDRITSIMFPEGLKYIGENAIAGCDNITVLSLSEGVEYIDELAFNGCDLLSDVTFPETLKFIGRNAFYECPSLSSVDFSQSDLVIDEGAFSCCNMLTEIEIPETVTSIGDGAFIECGNLTDIKLPENVVNLSNSVFSGTAYYNNQDNWDNGALYIGNYLIEVENSFSGDFTVREGTKAIAANAFSNCENILSVTIPESVVEIGRYAFWYCENLISVNLPSALTVLRDNVFGHCVKLPSISIPENVVVIEDGAFWNCNALNDIVLPEKLEFIGDSAFVCCQRFENVYIPENVSFIGEEAFGGGEYLDNINVDENNKYYKSVDGVLFDKKVETLIQYPARSSWMYKWQETSYEIPDTVKTIAAYAFAYCYELDEIIIPDSVTNIENRAFAVCSSLSSVVVPDSVEYLGPSAFSGCRNLINIKLSENLTFIPWGCFEGCSSIEAIDIPSNVNFFVENAFVNCSSLKSFVFPYGVDKIFYNIFSGCTSLESVTIPKTVKSVVHFVFYSCENLKYVFYGGTKAEWDSIELMQDGNQRLLDAKIHYEAVGHTYSDWLTTKKASVTSKGEKVKKCTQCGDVIKTATIAQLKCSKPKLSKIENTSDGVKITWGKVSGADSYAVYRKTGSSGKYSKIATVKGNSKVTYTDKSAKSGKKYYYLVKAVNEAGSSDSSSSKSIYHLADTTLSTPKSTKSGITLKWKKVTGADGYMVYRKTGSGSYSKIATVKGNSKVTYTDKKAKKGKTYTYKIKAYKSKTYSAYSNAKKIKDKY